MLHRLENEIEMIERHLEVLNAVVTSEPIGISKLSEMTRYSKYKVRYSLRVLELDGLIKPSPYGAITTSKVSEFLKDYKNVLDRSLARLEVVKTTINSKPNNPERLHA